MASMWFMSASQVPAPSLAGPTVQRAPEHRRLAFALLLSLLSHALLLSLTFGGVGLGLPGLVVPWRDRRIEAPDLRVVLVPARATPKAPAVRSSVWEPSQGSSIESLVVAEPARAPPLSHAPRAPAKDVADVLAINPTAQAEAERITVASAARAEMPVRANGFNHAAPPQIVAPAAIDAEPSDGAMSVVRSAPPLPASLFAVAPSASAPEDVMPTSRDADGVAQDARRQEAARQEAARLELARLEAERQEAARQAVAQLDAQRQEAARQEAARLELARLEAERQEAARQVAAQLDAQRQEVARQEAARLDLARLEAERQEAARQAAAQLDGQRQEAARQEAVRVEAARQEAARQEAVRVEAARPDAERQEAARQATAPREAPRVEADREPTARREAALRAIGRQLDEEADRAEAASRAARRPSTLPLSLSTARRARVWGRTDPNVELIQYVEEWARRIQFNTSVETVRDVAKRSHTRPMVTVAIRSGGSVESVTFVVSSGVAEVDEAIRRIVESQRPYQAFPPALAREFDVIEIRRIWHFDSAVRLY